MVKSSEIAGIIKNFNCYISLPRYVIKSQYYILNIKLLPDFILQVHNRTLIFHEEIKHCFMLSNIKELY